jgi:nucleoside-diphosphate-sugar epimerase
MKILVTGANGFVGRSLVAQLLERGENVRALVLPREAIPETWRNRVEVMRGDVTAPDIVSSAVAGSEAIYHLAAHVALWDKPELYERVTLGGTRHVLQAAMENAAHLILLSSVTVYGDALACDLCDEEHPFGTPFGPYGRSKQAQEKLVREFQEAHGLKATIVRAGPVFGPNCFAWVTAFVHLLKRRWPCYIGDGSQNSGLCYVENLAALLTMIPHAPQAVGRTYNANDGGELSWRQYVEDLAALAKAREPVPMSHRTAAFAAQSGEFLCRIFPAYKKIAFTREACNLMSADSRVPVGRACSELNFAPPVSHHEAMQNIARSLL